MLSSQGGPIRHCLFGQECVSLDPPNSNSEATVCTHNPGWSFLTYPLDKSYDFWLVLLSPVSVSFNPFSMQLAEPKLISWPPWVKSSSTFYYSLNKTQRLEVSSLTNTVADRMVMSVDFLPQCQSTSWAPYSNHTDSKLTLAFLTLESEQHLYPFHSLPMLTSSTQNYPLWNHPSTTGCLPCLLSCFSCLDDSLCIW